MILLSQGFDGGPLVGMGHQLVVNGADDFHLLGEILVGGPFPGGGLLGEIEEQLLHFQRVVRQAEGLRQIVERRENMVQRGLRGERHGVALGTKPPQNFLGGDAAQGQGGRQSLGQGVRVQGDGEALVVSQGKAEGGVGAAVHGVQGEIPGAQIEGEPLLHLPAHPPPAAVGDFQAGVQGGMPVRKGLALETQMGEGEAGKQGKGFHPSTAGPVGPGAVEPGHLRDGGLQQTARGHLRQLAFYGLNPIRMHGHGLLFEIFGLFYHKWGRPYNRTGALCSIWKSFRSKREEKRESR